MSTGKLTDVRIRAAKPRAQPFKLTDGGGLHLFITPAGTKTWRLRYELRGKEQTLSLERYPGMSLADAREKRDDAKKVLRAGGDPAAEFRRAAAAADASDTFEVVAKAWHKANLPRWSTRHAADVLGSLQTNIFPTLGAEPINSITPPMVLEALREIEERGAVETSHRVRQRMSDVFIYAIAAGIGQNDPAAIVKKALAHVQKRRQPAITKLADAKEILAKVEAIPGYPVTKLAMRLLAITVLRPGAFRVGLWSDFAALDDKEPVWIIPAERMKLKKEHKEDEAREFWVPLPSQAAAIIAALRKLTGKGTYLFPNLRGWDRPMSENALGYILNRAGYQGRHVPHGWRATFSTVMNELYPDDRAVIDLMLAHTPKDKVQAAYNRALYMTRRRELAQIWADLILAGLPEPVTLLTGRRK